MCIKLDQGFPYVRRNLTLPKTRLPEPPVPLLVTSVIKPTTKHVINLFQAFRKQLATSKNVMLIVKIKSIHSLKDKQSLLTKPRLHTLGLSSWPSDRIASKSKLDQFVNLCADFDLTCAQCHLPLLVFAGFGKGRDNVMVCIWA